MNERLYQVTETLTVTQRFWVHASSKKQAAQRVRDGEREHISFSQTEAGLPNHKITAKNAVLDEEAWHE